MRAGLALCALAAVPAGNPLAAQTVDGELALATDEDGLAKAALLLEPEAYVSIAPGVEAVMSVRAEIAGSETGTGTRRSFSPISAPLVKADDLRVEIDEFYLSIPAGALEFRLGKQEVAWGSIDGARVVDTVSPARLTEGLARNPRPDRIAIWAARMQAILGRVDIDLVVAPDPTVNQLAEPGAAFFPQAPRFLAGFEATGPLPPIEREDRGDLVGDATLAARVSYRLDATDLRVSFVRGIDQDGVPVFDGQRIELRHPRRHTLGFEFVRQLGAVVGRLEAAWTPDARFVVAGTSGTEIAEVDRMVGGLGADFSGPLDTYVNVQVILDHVSSNRELVRPATDVISTVRIQKDFDDDLHALRAEWLNSFTDGDGLVRLEMTRRLDDRFSLFLGGDLFYGSGDGIF
ncbi:MAG: hypothetical protein RIC51_10505, partial [Erythrobacter sp.]